jgi:hypothetical protein
MANAVKPAVYLPGPSILRDPAEIHLLAMAAVNAVGERCTQPEEGVVSGAAAVGAIALGVMARWLRSYSRGAGGCAVG